MVQVVFMKCLLLSRSDKEYQDSSLILRNNLSACLVGDFSLGNWKWEWWVRAARVGSCCNTTQNRHMEVLLQAQQWALNCAAGLKSQLSILQHRLNYISDVHLVSMCLPSLSEYSFKSVGKSLQVVGLLNWFVAVHVLHTCAGTKEEVKVFKILNALTW